MPDRLSHFILLAAAALTPVAATRAQDASSPQATPAKVSFSNAQKSFIKSVTGGLEILAAGDVNGDDNTDLIVLGDNSESNLTGVQLLLGDGKGGFSLAKSTGLPTCNNCSYNRVQLVDLNADGKLDLVIFDFGSEDTDPTDGICERNSGSLTLFLGDGKGNFRKTYSTGLSEVASSTVTADFNNDGKPDFAVYSTLSGGGCFTSEKSLDIFIDRGDGTLEAPHSVAIPTSEGSNAVNAAAIAPTNSESGTMFNQLASGDFNHDGKVDLALIRFDTSTGNATKIVDVLNGKGDGTFGSGPKYTFAERPIALAAADFNHDGRTDLAASLYSDSLGKFRIATLLAHQPEGFGWSSATPYNATYASLALADFNSDGNLDLASTPGANYYSFSVLTNAGSGRFSAPTTSSVTSTGTDTTDPIFAVPLKTGAKPSLIAGTPFNGANALPGTAPWSLYSQTKAIRFAPAPSRTTQNAAGPEVLAPCPEVCKGNHSRGMPFKTMLLALPPAVTLDLVKTAANDFLPTRKEFLALAREHTLVPVYRTITADLETPVSAFLRAGWPERECFLLESVENGEQLGRYTFIGLTPFKRIVARGNEISITEGKRVTEFEGDVFAVLRRALAGHKPARIAGLPPFTAGAVGFFSYDAVRQIERLPAKAKDELGVPDACLLFFDEVLAFDHVRKEIWLIVTADVGRSDPSEAYDKALRRLNKLEKRLSQPLPKALVRKASAAARQAKLKVKYRTAKKDFLAAVDRTKEYIAAGDIFQAVLSQRFDVEPGIDSFQVYRALRAVNPSPYMFFLRFSPDSPLAASETGKRKPQKSGAQKTIELAGSSPELLVRVHDGKVEYRPIAGTRPRGVTEAEDQALADEMIHDEKERAEHVMLVDLGRNDVGRVSQFGSVKVDRLMFVERYSHVMHIVSAIEGRLRSDLTAVDALRACFPAGTLSGAPKVRAMEIIEELEPARRGTYGGAVLYADFSGNLDSCIAIRSMLAQDGKGYVQAGAGIVADSVPESEHQESINKAQAVIRAIERAREL